jgi:two-component system, LytTR family, sensor kinase
MKLEITHYSTYRSLFHLCVVLVFAIILPLAAAPHSEGGPMTLRPSAIPVLNLDILSRRLLFSSILIPFYFINVYLLVPKLLVRRKYGMYLAAILLSIVGGIVLTKSIELLFFSFHFIHGRIPGPGIAIPMTLLFGIGTSFETIVRLEQEGRNQEAVERERISAELSFLKTQINPHFFFNTLNNIYSMAERNSDQTGKSILLLSNLMRYMLYDTNQGKILLTKEIKHLEEYIALQQLRIPTSEKIEINFNCTGNTHGVRIEPLIFLSFIENAFKHGISYNSKSFISISIAVTDNNLDFKVVNSKKATGKQTDNLHNGIGMTNTYRRLQLLYPKSHKLSVRDDDEFYFVHLSIDLKKEDYSNKISEINQTIHYN